MGAVYPLVYFPGYLVNERSAQVEANFYSTEKPHGELVWTGTTNTFKVIKELIKVVIKELENEVPSTNGLETRPGGSGN
jgi:hypothetical protein